MNSSIDNFHSNNEETKCELNISSMVGYFTAPNFYAWAYPKTDHWITLCNTKKNSKTKQVDFGKYGGAEHEYEIYFFYHVRFFQHFTF